MNRFQMFYKKNIILLVSVLIISSCAITNRQLKENNYDKFSNIKTNDYDLGEADFDKSKFKAPERIVLFSLQKETNENVKQNEYLFNVHVEFGAHITLENIKVNGSKPFILLVDGKKIDLAIKKTSQSVGMGWAIGHKVLSTDYKISPEVIESMQKAKNIEYKIYLENNNKMEIEGTFSKENFKKLKNYKISN